MVNALVSVVIITHDRSMYYLDRALRSVINQTVQPKEIIIVDGGADEHRSMTADYLKKENLVGKVELIGLNDLSAPEARNYGASRCTGDYLAFLDDDEWYVDRLERQLSVTGNHPAIINSPYDEEIGGDTVVFNFGKGEYPGILASNIIGGTSFSLIKRDVFETIGGFDTSFESNQEWDLFIRILKEYDAKYCDTLVGKKYTNIGISSDTNKRLSGWKSMFIEYKKDYRQHPLEYKCAAGTFCQEMMDRKCIKGFIIALFHKMCAYFYSL